jgi:fatty-acyl-CoA synthase
VGVNAESLNPGAGLNLADAWETIADSVGDAAALIHGTLVRSWSEFEQRAAALAGVFAAHGVGHDDKVAHYLVNGPEYLETTFGSFKARAVPLNVNYRYTAHELLHLFTNSDAAVAVVSGQFAARLAEIRDQLPLLKLVLQVGDEPLIDGALAYEDALAAATPAPRQPRDPADLWLLYTGGTTGMPKGVMWPQGALWRIATATFKALREPLPVTCGDLADAVRRVRAAGTAPRLMPAPPLMHGTATMTSFSAMAAGGAIVTLTGSHFEASEMFDQIEAHRVTNLTIVGDAFGRPMVDELRNGPPRDLSSLRIIVSSGTMFSQPVKDAVTEHLDVAVADLLGSSEAVGFASRTSGRNRPAATASFRLGPEAAVFNEAGEPVEPGSGESGVLAVGGAIPLGYYKDPEKSAETFRTYQGRVWSVPGDHARVEADGTITLLGRGSVCINTGGEKVFVEEVEEALKTHPAVLDANVVGLADERFGQRIAAVVSVREGAVAPSLTEVQDHVRAVLAGYKVPRDLVVVDRVVRGPNGKADYRWAATCFAPDAAAG